MVPQIRKYVIVFVSFSFIAYIKRVIAHPSFHNINFKQAEKMMETMDQGDVVIRPSSKGENHLTVTWKVAEGIYQHVDIREEGKENAFSLGHTLWINNEVNLSDIVWRNRLQFLNLLRVPKMWHFSCTD